MSTNNFSKFKHDPVINVITKEAMEERIYKVFEILWKTLSKSFGPYGAPTLICYPSRHVTKDGYTIMKNTSFACNETKVDQVIADMAYEVCSRLNYKVGDGTTSAIIATFSVFQSYMNYKKELEKAYVMPRDIMERYSIILDKIINKLGDKARPIDKSSPESIYNDIRDIVSISSNGDELVTDTISTIYKELGTPGITITNSRDGKTSARVIDGYRYDLRLLGNKFINNDNKTLELDETDVIIFAFQITESVYSKIIKPLNEECRFRGRRLMVCAPSYDEIMMRNIVAPTLDNEIRMTKSSNLILTTYRGFNEYKRKLAADFAVLMNTEILTRERVDHLVSKLNSGVPLTQLINVDRRNIEGTRCHVVITDANDNKKKHVLLTYGKDNFSNAEHVYDDYDESTLHLGYTRKCSIGLEDSTFTDLVYDENSYKALLASAEKELNDKLSKYEKFGRFNVEINEAQERLYGLRLKTGVIEVGGDSELTQSYLRDAVDDSVLAAESAYRNGIIKGCNIDLISTINEVLADPENTELDKQLISILKAGFENVYRTVLENAYGNITIKPENLREFLAMKFNIEEDVLDDTELITSCSREAMNEDGDIVIIDFIKNLSIKLEKVFDVSLGEFSDKVINSLQTDKEILIATIDLIKILITGNQMIVNVYHDFDYDDK